MVANIILNVCWSHARLYLNGPNGDAKNFAYNLIGIWNSSAIARQALKFGGFSYSALLSCASASYSYCVLTVAAKLGVTIGTINAVAGAIFAVGAIAGGICLWNYRIFY